MEETAQVEWTVLVNVCFILVIGKKIISLLVWLVQFVFCNENQILTSVKDLETMTVTPTRFVLTPRARTCVAALEVLVEMVKHVKVRRHCFCFVIFFLFIMNRKIILRTNQVANKK